MQNKPQPINIYLRFTYYLLPLAITLFVIEFGIQAVSAGLARVPRSTETLAAYGIAWGLILFVNSPLRHAKTLGLFLVNGSHSQRLVKQFLLVVSIILVASLALLSLTPVGYWLIEDLHSVDSSLGDIVRTALFWLMLWPIVRAMALFYTGLLLRIRRTDIVSYANIASIGAGIAIIFAMLPTPFIQANPIWLPILSLYANVLVELGIVYWGVRRYGQAIQTPETPETEPLTYRAIFQFFWPIVFIIMIQEGSRILINIFIARGSVSEAAATEALAVLTVAYALGQFPYRWLVDIRNMMSSFQDEPNSLFHIGRFAIACGAVSLAMMLILYWTPIRVVILEQYMGLAPEFAAKCIIPLMIYAIFSPVVTLRTYAQGITMLERRTHIFAYVGPARLVAILLALVTYPLMGITGASLGVSALATGFSVEAVTVWWGIRGYSRT
ncbi:MAG: hypothetical protein AAF639_28625 [Chloroflexota bacterium]